MSEYIIKYDDQQIIVESGTLTFFMSKLINDSFSIKHIKDNTITVGKETFEHICNYVNIKKIVNYDYFEIKNMCDYLSENTKLSLNEYLKKLDSYKNIIMEQILLSFDEPKSYDN